MILLIDNYDSFAHNLARYLVRLGHRVETARNDAIDCQQIVELEPAAIVLSPGPCTPNEAGVSLELVRRLHEQFPILGVCLGHQIIAAALGAKIVRCPPIHGRVSEIHHHGTGVFAGLPQPFAACRYHSLAVDESSLPGELKAVAHTADGLLMGIQHEELPLVGLQFHPEAALTQHGFDILAKFLRLARLEVPDNLPEDEVRRPRERQDLDKRFSRPVTF